jgi:hypothetical protein
MSKNERKGDGMNGNEHSHTIPAWLDDSDLSVYAFRLYAHLKRRWGEGHQDILGLREIAERCKMSVDSVIKARHDLIAAGALTMQEAMLPSEAKLVLEQKTPQGRAILSFSAMCEWRGCYTAVLHSHHYPTPKSEGGTDTVRICPNCHTGYHALTRQTFSLNDMGD